MIFREINNGRELFNDNTNYHFERALFIMNSIPYNLLYYKVIDKKNKNNDCLLKKVELKRIRAEDKILIFKNKEGVVIYYVVLSNDKIEKIEKEIFNKSLKESKRKIKKDFYKKDKINNKKQNFYKNFQKIKKRIFK
jgi:hypothetical protein